MSELDELRAAADAFTRGQTFYEGMPLTNGTKLVAVLREALDGTLAVIEQVRVQMELPIHPYGDRSFPTVPQHEFLREAYDEDFAHAVMAALATSPPDALDAVKAAAWDEGRKSKLDERNPYKS